VVDLNPSVLAFTAQRLRRYAPRTLQADILQPLPLPAASFASIGLNYVLHCLPGSMREKSSIFSGLAELLTPGGVLFGSTALGRGVHYGWLGRRAMTVYNNRGILSNADDSLRDLQAGLDSAFSSAEVRVRGTVALFTAQR
jgi:SAM-dependent methyltransferase